MPRVPYGLTTANRERGNLPQFQVVNCFVEAAPTEPAGVILQSRPGLRNRSADMGVGPVRCLFKGDGVLDSALYGVSGSALYREDEYIGTVDGSGPVSMAGFEDKLFAAAGGSLWGYNGSTLATVTFPDGANVTKAIVGASRLIALRADTEKFYWSDVLSSTIGGLSFASAESQPDRLKDMLFWGDNLLLFGAETVETWPNTTDPDAPFQPLEGRTFRRGIRGTGCATLFGPTYAWITNLNQVCIETPENIVSDAGLEEKIAASTTAALYTFYLEGTEFLAVRLDDATHCYSFRTPTWAQMESDGEANWIPQCFAGGVFGSAIDGKTLEWGNNWEDLGGTLERRFEAGIALNSGGLTVNNLSLRTNPGNTTYLTGTYANPTVEVRFSRDAGRTWGNWRQTSLGVQGDYRKQPRWLGCGMFSQPGFMCEFRVSDPVDFRVSDVLVNEPYGGV